MHAPHSFVTARNRDRSHFAPWGLKGGQAGKTSAFVLNRGSNRETNLGNTDILTTEPGDRVYIKSAGAGGWGNPWERDAARVLADVRRGFVSDQAADQEYGVIIRAGRVDETATEERRKAMAGADPKAFFGFNAHRIGYEKFWTRAAYAELIRIVAALPVHWRFFVKGKLFEVINRVPAAEREDGAEEVRKAYAKLIAGYPQLETMRQQAAE